MTRAIDCPSRFVSMAHSLHSLALLAASWPEMRGRPVDSKIHAWSASAGGGFTRPDASTFASPKTFSSNISERSRSFWAAL
jgi:hypothetical protein